MKPSYEAPSAVKVASSSSNALSELSLNLDEVSLFRSCPAFSASTYSNHLDSKQHVGLITCEAHTQRCLISQTNSLCFNPPDGTKVEVESEDDTV